MPSPNFERAIHDLDHAQQDPRFMQDARNSILNEIRDVTARHPEINPQRAAQAIVAKINEVENSYPHAHHDVQLVQNQQGYLDVAPIQGYNQGYNPEYQQPAPPPPPPYAGVYPQGGYPPPGGYYEQAPNPGAVVGGVVAGTIIGGLLFGHRR